MTCTDKEAIDWLLTRPPIIRNLMLNFPPACYVRLVTEGPACEWHADWVGRQLQVMSYDENGTISVLPTDKLFEHRVFVDPADLEVVGFHDGQDLKWISDILGSDV